MNSSIAVRSEPVSRRGVNAGNVPRGAATVCPDTLSELMNVAELIERDRVHGSLYTDPAIFEAELERIWHRTWVFVGHESEVREPHDFAIKTIGPQRGLMRRHRQGEIHLLLHRCPHPAALGCAGPPADSS